MIENMLRILDAFFGELLGAARVVCADLWVHGSRPARLRGWRGNRLKCGRLLEASDESRAAVWEGIVDAGHDHLDLPRRIVWDDSRNQREYLNVRDADHDAIYYAHAYKY